MVENYPGNSNKQRKSEISQEKEERPKLKSVVKTAGVVQKPSLGSRIRETFAGEDAKTTGIYVVVDVIVPALKAMLFDTITQSADRMLFGGRSVIQNGLASAPRRGGTLDYNKVSTRAAQNGAPGRRELARGVRENHQFDQIRLDTRGEAEMVLDTMQDLIDRFQWVTVPEFYSLVNVTAEFTDEKWGWGNISAAQIRPSRGGYVILLPSPEYDG